MYIKNQYDKITLDKKSTNFQDHETIVQNMDRVIYHIQNNTILATKKRYHFAIKNIKELNDILVNPIEIISARPAQKTYPNVNGIYLLLRSMGILRFEVSKKEIVMKIDEELLANWNALNHTEQYFTLLEIWLIHSTPRETIDGFHHLPLSSLRSFFTEYTAHSLKKKIEFFSYSSEIYNIALFDMFGFIDIVADKPTIKNNWNISDIKVKPLVKKILPLLKIKKTDEMALMFGKAKLGYFKQKLQVDYKEYVNLLEYPKITPFKGTYRLKISLNRCYRIIEIDANHSFEFLASTILEQFDFDNDHLYEFKLINRFGKDLKIYHSSLDGDGTNLWDEESYLKDLILYKNESFTFLFDFGAGWEFDILVEDVDADKSMEIDSVKLIKSHGDAPEQYTENDDDWIFY